MQERDGTLTPIEDVADIEEGRPLWSVGTMYRINGTVVKLRKITKRDLLFRTVPDSEQNGVIH